MVLAQPIIMVLFMRGEFSQTDVLQVSMALFAFLHLRRFNKKWSLLFLWVIIVSYTRIYLGVHYPADLVCGAALGAIFGGFVYWLSLKLDPYRALNTNKANG